MKNTQERRDEKLTNMVILRLIPQTISTQYANKCTFMQLGNRATVCEWKSSFIRWYITTAFAEGKEMDFSLFYFFFASSTFFHPAFERQRKSALQTQKKKKMLCGQGSLLHSNCFGKQILFPECASDGNILDHQKNCEFLVLVLSPNYAHRVHHVNHSMFIRSVFSLHDFLSSSL